MVRQPANGLTMPRASSCGAKIADFAQQVDVRRQDVASCFS
ncbi:hypothetical protein OCO_07140 [Mycobacterium intracellulare MOTT-02]|uniref:Uncharacterized protein n=1 Tax=Mycobacterium intracellulare (strain ATCC 13950 / DSM 43223 / JCM 6384 / NCTC 13025 / 3600) TaxID=487521 RepID=H8IQX9_MYCIA|nr:hypothetical protein OCU_07140 [Mycobacterium intracellulare ATCC 13950]AFC47078.1 hypothetical protein OCO_07140 [Mycobacterium intracellulare MOTT-02]EUA25424.1 hypothetical protein I548_3510 [Mycobacterium intracellulare]